MTDSLEPHEISLSDLMLVVRAEIAAGLEMARERGVECGDAIYIEVVPAHE